MLAVTTFHSVGMSATVLWGDLGASLAQSAEQREKNRAAALEFLITCSIVDTGGYT